MRFDFDSWWSENFKFIEYLECMKKTRMEIMKDDYLSIWYWIKGIYFNSIWVIEKYKISSYKMWIFLQANNMSDNSDLDLFSSIMFNEKIRSYELYDLLKFVDLG